MSDAAYVRAPNGSMVGGDEALNFLEWFFAEYPEGSSDRWEEFVQDVEDGGYFDE